MQKLDVLFLFGFKITRWQKHNIFRTIKTTSKILYFELAGVHLAIIAKSVFIFQTKVSKINLNKRVILNKMFRHSRELLTCFQLSAKLCRTRKMIPKFFRCFYCFWG